MIKSKEKQKQIKEQTIDKDKWKVKKKDAALKRNATVIILAVCRMNNAIKGKIIKLLFKHA